MHLVTDFDGVWTEPAQELAAVHQTLAHALSQLSRRPMNLVHADLAAFREAVLAAPDQHGWRIEGRLSSYVDEDSFALPTSIGQFLERDEHPAAAVYREAVLQEWDCVADFLDHCYHSTCARFRQDHPHDLAHGATEVLRWLLRHGVTLSFVTNAPASKVIDWFGAHGLVIPEASDPAAATAPLTVHGRAGKQWLGAEPRSVDCAGRQVQVDRPHYRAILEREQPDAVIGDVWSLDLALPAVMREAGEKGAPRHLGLMHLRHTPDWVLQQLTAQGQDARLSHVTALPRWISRWTADLESGQAPRDPNRSAIPH